MSLLRLLSRALHGMLALAVFGMALLFLVDRFAIPLGAATHHQARVLERSTDFSEGYAQARVRALVRLEDSGEEGEVLLPVDVFVGLSQTIPITRQRYLLRESHFQYLDER